MQGEGGVEKVAISDQYLAIARKRLKRCMVYAAMRLISIESSYHPCITFTAIVPGTYSGESKMWFKKRSFTSFTVENESLATDISLYFRNG